ncbi:MAG TPA: MDR family MFS transporter [Vicinamibacterales bacterium]|nr:MDR family MFS transporter [Vicinamibacterales bacterium]
MSLIPHLQVSLPRRRAITAGLLLGMSLGALEATVVSTAMPTVIATLGGLAHYSWVFSAYLLTSTASVPIWGRLSDLYGRRRMYLLGVAIFLIGSVMSGAATSMFTLIVARAIQGLGAGAIIPLSMTIVGELYTLGERARTQALFSGVWGVASIAGPLVGGYITDALSWRWVFYLNVPFGFCCMAVLALAYPATRTIRQVQVDWLGAALLFSGISTLLIAIGGDAGSSAAWLVATVVLLGGFALAQQRAAEPILPLSLVRLPVISRTLVVVFLVGIAMFGAIAFIPLFVQSVQGGTATQAGQAVTPLFLGWVVMSIVGARMTVRLGYRVSAVAGSILMTAGFIGLSLLDSHSPRTLLVASCTMLGAGMGTQMLSLLLAVQHAVDRSQLGLATSLNQFSRSIGAALGVSAMGAILARGLVGMALPGGAESALASGAIALTGPMRDQFAAALHRVFVAGSLVSGAGLLATLFLPPVHFSQGVPSSAGEQMIEAEMTNLQPDDEPIAINE